MPRRLRGAFAVLSLIALPGVAQAGCFGPGQPLFSCSFKTGKSAVNVCLQNGVVSYFYGAKGKTPDLLLVHPGTEVYMRPWNGIGRYIWEEMEVANGSHRYVMDYSIDKMTPDALPEANLRVFQGEREMATLTCDPGSLSSANFSPLLDLKQASGQCWNDSLETWSFCE